MAVSWEKVGASSKHDAKRDWRPNTYLRERGGGKGKGKGRTEKHKANQINRNVAMKSNKRQIKGSTEEKSKHTWQT